MSILHIVNVTDSRWKKSHWAPSSTCLCHSLSSTAAFSRMMRKLFSQLQHPLLFFFFPPHPILVLPRPSPNLSSAEWLRSARSRDCRTGSQSRPDIAIARPGPAVQLPGREPRSGPGHVGMPRKSLQLPGQLRRCLPDLQVWSCRWQERRCGV